MKNAESTLIDAPRHLAAWRAKTNHVILCQKNPKLIKCRLRREGAVFVDVVNPPYSEASDSSENGSDTALVVPDVPDVDPDCRLQLCFAIFLRPLSVK